MNENDKVQNLKNDIVKDSYYLVNLFTENDKKVTQLQIQKLMYLFEAFYMCIEKESTLYNCNFNAWAFGPVAIPLYKEYKSFGSANIILSEEKIKQGNEMNLFKKKVMEKIYNNFGELSPEKLVNLTHMKGSPWYEKWMENDKKVVYGEKSYIDKEKTRDWFAENFIEKSN